MTVANLSGLHAFLADKGLFAKKRLSQNFLVDGNILQKIVGAASVQPGDFVLEIGPGPGALTEVLLAKGADVLAIEMDPTFAKALERFNTPKLSTICADVLKFPLESYLREKNKSCNKPCKVIANLPYHITTPILTLLLPLYPLISCLTLMVQKEFADRLNAPVKSPNYSSLTLFLQCYAKIIQSFKVTHNCFYPKPTVDSAVIHCALHPCTLGEKFFQLTRTAFGKRRKMLRSSLHGLYDPILIEESLISLGLSSKARPEELDLNQFVQLFAFLNNRIEPKATASPQRLSPRQD